MVAASPEPAYYPINSDLSAFLPACPESGQLPRPPKDGLHFGIGPHFPIRFASVRRLVFHGSTACPESSPDYSILILRVTLPGRADAVFVSIGLTKPGTVARTILYSLRAA